MKFEVYNTPIGWYWHVVQLSPNMTPIVVAISGTHYPTADAAKTAYVKFTDWVKSHDTRTAA